jgi:hypothetical protein
MIKEAIISVIESLPVCLAQSLVHCELVGRIS